MIRQVTVLVVLVALVSLVNSNKVDFEDCGNNEIKWVKIPGCSRGQKCVIRTGKKTRFATRFTPSRDSESPKISMVANVNGVEMEVPEANLPKNPCDHFECPLKKGKAVTFDFKIEIPTFLPSGDISVTAKLTDDKGVLACGTVEFSVKGLVKSLVTGFF